MRCDDSKLIALLQSRDAEESTADTVAHLETCESCRQRLEVLAADEFWWTELSESLSDDQWEPSARKDASGADPHWRPERTLVIALEPSLPDELPAVCETVALNFLEAPRHPDLLGRLGRYDIECVIGTGGMGIVLKAFDSELHRYVAIKVLSPHLAGVGAARQRFAREARAAQPRMAW